MAHNDTSKNLIDELQREEGHSYAGWGGGSLIAVILVVLLIIWLL